MARYITPYADPGYLTNGQTPRWPLSTQTEIHTAWAEFDTNNNGEYSPDQAQRIEAAIKAAASRMQIDLT